MNKSRLKDTKRHNIVQISFTHHNRKEIKLFDDVFVGSVSAL